MQGVAHRVSTSVVFDHRYPEQDSCAVCAASPALGIDLPSVSADQRAALYFMAKRCVDITLATVLIVLLLPLMLVICLAIKLDSPGAVLLGQPRVGHRGRQFRMYKFRSMRPDRRACSVPIGFPDRRRSLKVQRDPRITRVGRMLRKTSLDELPQLFNIVRGEMSFVGPRPEQPELLRFYSAAHYRRHDAVPGLTGVWQIHGRCIRTDGCAPAEDLRWKLLDDLYYLEHRSLGFDARIMFLTIPVVFRGRGAA
jgi:lipopolysaccharide/colanic/teichoic acid biosynthesis glycosyltransferase